MELVNILMNNFTINPEEKVQPPERHIYRNPRWRIKTLEEESYIKRSLEIKILQFLEESDRKEDESHIGFNNLDLSNPKDSLSSAVCKRILKKTFEYTQRIRWDGFESFRSKLENLAFKLKSYENFKFRKSTLSCMEDISTVGVNFMKIISKLYSGKSQSVDFEDEQKILTYTENFWNIFLLDKKCNAEDLEMFCKSIGAKSEIEINRCLSIKFDNGNYGLSKMFSEMRTKIELRDDENRLLQYAWYFAIIRASVFYPKDILIANSANVKRRYRRFISLGILYFAQKYGKYDI
ncbi:hypothetical protein BY996DRAFT_6734199 [Phakopsora pachyrhizi]|nr:hypothetical protein BY996DRAFT_6734199 [Phakopsora pachyrhizi]